MRKRRPDEYRNSIEGPIYQSASYYFENAEEVVQGLHEKTLPAGRYARYSNPTWLDVEHRLSGVFSAERSLVFASGMAAHFTTFMTLMEPGMEVLLPAESYRQVRNVFHHILPKLGVVVHEVSIRDPERFLEEVSRLSGRLSIVHLEMPSSPHMYLIDVSEVRSILGDDVVVTMDTSFAPPPNFSALRWGVDLTICSATKYLGGHGDLMAGVVAGRRDLVERITWYRDTTGPVMDGYAAALLRRGLYTLVLRMQRVNEAGLAVARFLEDHPAVQRVYYTGLPSHPHAALAQRYLEGHGGVVTFELPLDEAATAEVVGRMRIPYMASNFGAPQSLVEQSSFFTYFEYSDAELASVGVNRGTIRLSVGYADDTDALIDDLGRALARA